MALTTVRTSLFLTITLLLLPFKGPALVGIDNAIPTKVPLMIFPMTQRKSMMTVIKKVTKREKI